jgi:hypothetical protein
MVGPGGLLGHRHSLLDAEGLCEGWAVRVTVPVQQVGRRCLCNKKPLVPGGKRGERVGCGRWVVQTPASADALSKYENSGAHGSDPLPGTRWMSSGWDAGLIM